MSDAETGTPGATRAGSLPVPSLSSDRRPYHEVFIYNDALVRAFLLATILWGLVAFLVGLVIAHQLTVPALNFGISYTSFGRLRPLHTNAAIFAFAGNAVFAAIYHSTQRLCKARMFSDAFGWIHFWGWQAIIVAAALTLADGHSRRAKSTPSWSGRSTLRSRSCGWSSRSTFSARCARRRERHMYVALWFYIATIVTIAVLHVFNSLEIPAGLLKSYPVYAGVQDAFMQWWYGHNAVGFFLTTPFLGLMYYFLPKAAERPVYSLPVEHHSLLVVGVHLYLGRPASSALHGAAGMGLDAGHVVFRHAMDAVLGWHDQRPADAAGRWHKVAADPILKFFVVGVTFYGMSTFEGPDAVDQERQCSVPLHGLDDRPRPRRCAGLDRLHDVRHDVLAAAANLPDEAVEQEAGRNAFLGRHVGILLYIVPIYVAGLTQGLMWRAIDSTGNLAYPDFVETVLALMPMYWLRVLGGILYLAGGGAVRRATV